MSKTKMGFLVTTIALLIVWGCAGMIKSRAKVPQIEGAQYAGTRTCIEERCHPDCIDKIKNSRHAHLFEKDSLDKPACELCHGKASLHLASTGDPDLILIYKDMNPKQQSEVCLTCHSKGAMNKWYNSAHYQNDISCNECHLSHGTSDAQLLKAPEPEICYRCHPDKQQEFSLASTHKFEKQGFRCLNCHSSHEQHDTMGKKEVRVKICLKCHEKYNKKFEHEHKPVKEDCLGCHMAHGSEYPKLAVGDIRSMCNSCHSVTHQIFLLNRFYVDGEKKLRAGKCLDCHKKVHGSKYDQLMSRKPPTRGRPAGFTPPVPGNAGFQRSIERQQQ
jgi:DmsE family decaheme c-type cytochrome